MFFYVMFLHIHHIKVYFWSLKNTFLIFKIVILGGKFGKYPKMNAFFVRPNKSFKSKEDAP